MDLKKRLEDKGEGCRVGVTAASAIRYYKRRDQIKQFQLSHILCAEKVLACLVTLGTIFRFHHSFVNAGPIPLWSLFFLSLSFFFFFFSKALLCHYPFTIARKRTECEDQGKACMRAHTHTHTQACTHGAPQRCCFCFISLIAPASGNLLPLVSNEFCHGLSDSQPAMC